MGRQTLLILLSLGLLGITTGCYIDPSYTDPSYTDPSYTDPAYTDPSYTDPSYTDPSYTDPSYTDPSYTDPSYTDSAYPDPAYHNPSVYHYGAVYGRYRFTPYPYKAYISSYRPYAYRSYRPHGYRYYPSRPSVHRRYRKYEGRRPERPSHHQPRPSRRVPAVTSRPPRGNLSNMPARPPSSAPMRPRGRPDRFESVE